MTKFILILVVALQIPASFAKDFDVIMPGRIRALIGNFPSRGSAEETADFNELHRLQDTRTEEQCAAARLESESSFNSFFAGAKGPLTVDEAKRVKKIVLRYYAESGINITIAKTIYKRPRPYLTDERLTPCIPKEGSYAYPSGHTAMSRAVAHLLARIYPEKAEALYRRADEIAFHRVLGGVHHPSDIVAGKKLGDEIADVVIRKTGFLKESAFLAK